MVAQAGAGEGVELSMEEVSALLEEGKALGLQLKGLPKLISAMAAARAWNVRATRALRQGPPIPLLICPFSLSSLPFQTS